MKLSFEEKAYIIVSLDMRLTHLKELKHKFCSEDHIETNKYDIEALQKIKDRFLNNA